MAVLQVYLVDNESSIPSKEPWLWKRGDVVAVYADEQIVEPPAKGSKMGFLHFPGMPTAQFEGWLLKKLSKESLPDRKKLSKESLPDRQPKALRRRESRLNLEQLPAVVLEQLDREGDAVVLPAARSALVRAI